MKKYFLVLILISVGFSCKPKLTDKELAMQHYEAADSLFKSMKFNAAKNQLDSIELCFPKEVEVRKKAEKLMLNIQLVEEQRNLNYADSMVKVKRNEFEKELKKFAFEKDEKYQTVGNYVFKKQQYTTNRTMIKPYVEENGRFLLHSIYYGSPIKHTSVKFLNSDNLSVSTEVVPIKSGYNYSFSDGEATCETVVYRSKNNYDVATFVEGNSNSRIQVTLNNGRKGYTYTLTDVEKQAILEAYKLSVILSDYRNLERIINVANKKIALFQVQIAEIDLK